MQRFLHVGCGRATKKDTTKEFNSGEWLEVRFDIDPTVGPDIVGTMTDLSSIETGNFDALFSSHNIEHLYAHEVNVALAEFLRVLSPDGYLVLTCPDLQSVCELVAEDKLLDKAYMSPAGPISPVDIIYGFRPSIASGNTFMAHKYGFTKRTLTENLISVGFRAVACVKRGPPKFDLWAVATKTKPDKNELLQIARRHFPA